MPSRSCLGVTFAITVACIWVAASYIVTSLESEQVDAVVLTVVSNSTFMILLPVYEVNEWFQRKKVKLDTIDAADSQKLLCIVAPKRPVSRRTALKIAAKVFPIWFTALLTFNLSLAPRMASVTANTIISSTSSVWTLAMAVTIAREQFAWSKLGGCLLCVGGVGLVAWQQMEPVAPVREFAGATGQCISRNGSAPFPQLEKLGTVSLEACVSFCSDINATACEALSWAAGDEGGCWIWGLDVGPTDARDNFTYLGPGKADAVCAAGSVTSGPAKTATACYVRDGRGCAARDVGIGLCILSTFLYAGYTAAIGRWLSASENTAECSMSLFLGCIGTLSLVVCGPALIILGKLQMVSITLSLPQFGWLVVKGLIDNVGFLLLSVLISHRRSLLRRFHRCLTSITSTGTF